MIKLMITATTKTIKLKIPVNVATFSSAVYGSYIQPKKILTELIIPPSSVPQFIQEREWINRIRTKIPTATILIFEFLNRRVKISRAAI